MRKWVLLWFLNRPFLVVQVHLSYNSDMWLWSMLFFYDVPCVENLYLLSLCIILRNYMFLHVCDCLYDQNLPNTYMHHKTIYRNEIFSFWLAYHFINLFFCFDTSGGSISHLHLFQTCIGKMHFLAVLFVLRVSLLIILSILLRTCDLWEGEWKNVMDWNLNW